MTGGKMGLIGGTAEEMLKVIEEGNGRTPVDALVSFSRDDVIKVARALLEDHTYFDTGDYSKDQYCCNYCSGKTKEWSRYTEIENLKHDLDCPILIARDLLTRS